MTVVLLLAAIVRVGAIAAYWPALYYFDSFRYLDLANSGGLVGIAPDRPSGYPILLELLSVPERKLGLITLLQHGAGLAGGVLLYALLVRLGVRRWLAVAAAALVLFDAYAIALEQEIMPEAFFTLALVLSFYLAVGRDRGAVALGASGLLLGAAVTFRTASVFAIPVWAIYVLWAQRRLPVVAAAAAGVAAPLLAYGAFHYIKTDRFGITQADGWFLYARIGQIGECGGADIPAAGRPLCVRTARDRGKRSAYFMWAGGPANRVFGGLSSDNDRQERTNRILREFALAIIRDRPLRYAGVVAEDFPRYFRPGVRSEASDDLALDLPDGNSRFDARASERGQRADKANPVYFPRVNPPARLMHGYGRVVHTPRWLLGGLALIAVIALALVGLSRGRAPMPRRRETFLLAGAGLAMLLGTAASHEFNLRYLIPAVPLLIAGGVLAATDLYGLARAREPAAAEPGRAPAGSGATRSACGSAPRASGSPGRESPRPRRSPARPW